APGEHYQYSNSGYFLLGEIVRRTTGQTLGAFLREQVFAPVGMTRTYVRDDQRVVVENQATGYEGDRTGGVRPHMSPLVIVGDGTVYSSVEDLARWLPNFTHDRVSPGLMVPAMLARGRLNDGSEIAYAGGLVWEEYRGMPLVRHGGAWVGFRSSTFRFPSEGV